MKCPGDSHATCGGNYTVNIYHTGIKSEFESFAQGRQGYVISVFFLFLGFIPQNAISESSNDTKKPVKIVFLLTLNGRALRQVKRLLKILYHRDHYYYIHIDIVSIFVKLL